MNKRIFELAVEAELRATLLFNEEKLEKFTELIVRECLEQVCDEVQYESDWKLADAVTKRVLEHFGVE